MSAATLNDAFTYAAEHVPAETIDLIRRMHLAGNNLEAAKFAASEADASVIRSRIGSLENLADKLVAEAHERAARILDQAARIARTQYRLANRGELRDRHELASLERGNHGAILTLVQPFSPSAMNALHDDGSIVGLPISGDRFARAAYSLTGSTVSTPDPARTIWDRVR